ncbi:fimbria/pilus periplasmic chaperone [Shigella flexneri]
MQRIDAMMNGQVKVQGLPDINKLPADRESVFYFNVEIPPNQINQHTADCAADAYQTVLATEGAGEHEHENRGSIG